MMIEVREIETTAPVDSESSSTPRLLWLPRTNCPGGGLGPAGGGLGGGGGGGLGGGGGGGGDGDGGGRGGGDGGGGGGGLGGLKQEPSSKQTQESLGGSEQHGFGL